MSHALAPISSTSASDVQGQDQPSNQEIPGCWEVVKKYAADLFDKIAKLPNEAKFALVSVVVLYSAFIGMHVLELFDLVPLCLLKPLT